jgi:hypothetical protein
MPRFARLRRSIVATFVAAAAQLVSIVSAIASTGGGDFPLGR